MSCAQKFSVDDEDVVVGDGLEVVVSSLVVEVASWVCSDEVVVVGVLEVVSYVPVCAAVEEVSWLNMAVRLE